VSRLGDIAGNLSLRRLDLADRKRRLLAESRRHAHAVRHRVSESVDATAHALQVNNDDIDVLQHLVGGLARLAIERVDGKSRATIARVTGLDHVVLHVTTYAVLRTEQSGQVDRRMIEEQIGGVTERVID
jgi:hypothetical protein